MQSGGFRAAFFSSVCPVSADLLSSSVRSAVSARAIHRVDDSDHYQSGGLKITPELDCRGGMRTAGEGGLSLVFASRAAVPRPPARHTAAMLLAGCTSVCIVAVPVPCGRSAASADKLAAAPLHVSCCHIASRLQLRLADKKSLLGVNSVRSTATGLPTISCSAILLFTSSFGQNTFHSRMPDTACSLHPVWTMQMICQHRPY